jgi:hypothetical protein
MEIPVIYFALLVGRVKRPHRTNPPRALASCVKDLTPLVRNETM